MIVINIPENDLPAKQFEEIFHRILIDILNFSFGYISFVKDLKQVLITSNNYCFNHYYALTTTNTFDNKECSFEGNCDVTVKLSCFLDVLLNLSPPAYWGVCMCISKFGHIEYVKFCVTCQWSNRARSKPDVVDILFFLGAWHFPVYCWQYFELIGFGFVPQGCFSSVVPLSCFSQKLHLSEIENSITLFLIFFFEKGGSIFLKMGTTLIFFGWHLYLLGLTQYNDK